MIERPQDCCYDGLFFKRVKCEVLKESSQGASDGRYPMFFRFIVLHVAQPKPQRKRGGLGTQSPPPSINYINFEMEPLAVKNITQI